jgi:hypothetical protein
MLALMMVLSLAMGGSHAAQAQTPPPNPVPSMKKVVWVWLENTSYSQMILQRYVKNLFATYPSARLSNYLPVSTVTQSNVMSMIAGTDFGIQDNELTRIFSPTIVDLLEAKNIPWRAYVEEYPGACYLGAGIGDYKRYRVPFLSTDHVQTDRYLCMKVVGFKNLDDDIKYDSLPDFTFVVPSLKGSGATSNANTAEATLKRVIDPIVTNADLMQETTIFITTVNNTDVKKPEMFTMIIGNGLTPGYAYTINTPYNHFNVLRTIEDGLKLGNLNQNDAKASPIVGFWKP